MNNPIDPPIDALTDWVILEALGGTQDKTPSGLLIPSTATKSEDIYQQYRVVAAGPDCVEDRMSELADPALVPGDVVFAAPNMTGLLRYNGSDYRVCRYEQLAGIVRDDIHDVDS